MNNQLSINNPLTKKIILLCFQKMILDHDIVISEEKLKQKIELTFDDCKDMTSEQFISISEQIRKKENLFGKLPTSKAFLNFFEPEKTLAETINKMAGASYLTAITVVNGKAMLHFKSLADYDAMRILENIQDIKCKISSELRTDGFEIDIRS